jgi:hypothetical protein
MARYRALHKLFIAEQLIEPGEIFESDLDPGRNWAPEDDAARVRCKERDEKRGALNAAAAKLDNRPTAPEAIPIPEGWVDLRKEQVVNLSRRLGAPRNNNFAQAIVWIEKEIARRTEAANSMQGAA